MNRLIHLLRLVDRALIGVEVAGVTAALSLMVVLKFADVVMRNTGHGGIPEFASIAQHLVIWVGMLGASLAAADRKHIAIELFAPLVTPQGRRVVEGIVDVATIFFCALVCYIAWQWIEFDERANPKTLFEVAAIDLKFKRWWSLSIVPIGFGLIGLRFTKLAIERIFVDEPVDREAEAAREAADYDRRFSSDEREAAAP